MHDPCTVAFKIRRPWRDRPSQWSPKGYRPPLITIWHVDPEKHSEDTSNCRDDDSCGWFTPPIPKKDFDAVRKLGEEQWGSIFEKRRALAEGKDYASVCFEPTTYDAIYWAWRRIKYEGSRHRWQYGPLRNPLTSGELQQIYLLASNPVDNLQSRVAEVQDAESCGDFFCLILKCYRRFHRPWWKHPRYHFWHWRFQIHPLQKLRRRMFDRCCECGKPFGWNESPISNWGGGKLWHGACHLPQAARPAMTCESVPPDLGGTA